MTVDVVADVTVVTVTGELDLSSASAFSRILTDAIGPSGAVLIDLCSCTFVDSTGLSTILTAVQQAKATRVRLAVACLPNGAPRKLFDLIIGHTMFATCPSRESGIAQLHAPRAEDA